MSWADLPPDLLRLISGRLRETGDFVRFHSTCQAWRDAAPATLPEFLPWLLAPGRDYPSSTAQLRSIFSKTTWCAPRTYGLRKRWLATEDGAGAWLLTSETGPAPSLRLVDPFTGAAAAVLPPFPAGSRTGGHRGRIPYANGFVLADGAVVLFSIESFHKHGCFVMAAVLRPGDAAWAEGKGILMDCASCGGSIVCAAAYHDGEIVLADVLQVDTVKLRVASGGVLDVMVTPIRKDPPWNCFPRKLQPQPRRIYTFKSRGELLAACLLLDTTKQDGGGAMSVSVYALEPGEGGGGRGDPRWVARDAWSLRDRVLFLGFPASFAVDAARLGGAVSGGCAYFVHNSWEAGVARRKNVPEACRVYRYSFEDGGAAAVEELPTGAGWDNELLITWFAPRPSAIAPVREIRERLLQGPNRQQGAPCTTSIIRAPRAAFGPPFTFFVGNLPSGVGSLKLEQFFAGFGEVTDARVKCSFGFVTMAPIGEPDDVFAALDGEYFFGHVLRVKFAEERPEGPFVMPLLAPNKARK
ncbi:unnamed protein product [Urochloa decumbens]|uniref:RRM domain-containing protein n=1 Tax=Urochloa decumbens TaxID=240449 RepID=A0ABC8Y2U2_9POAL